MPPKLIALDLDYTLLRTDKTISDFTADTFRRVREKGIRIAYATGRHKGAAAYREVLQPVGLVLDNGALVTLGEEILYEAVIPAAAVRSMLTALRRQVPALEFGISLPSGFYYSPGEGGQLNAWAHSPLQSDLSDLPEEPAYRISYWLPEQSAFSREAEETMSALLPELCYLEISYHCFAMLMPMSATKTGGLRILADALGIRPAEIIAFGDDCNDVEMLSFAGIGVAMGNAIDECKAAADACCGTCDADGVARWIHENLL
ncbi:MAG: Cof-type HAD-IIB family hydrolase [Oscillospiraceae bacterium]|jgi:Cof subfamily protein (haloacid dehalogenase superfamily)|nr:Cof-type HAD-IIB family hydrolase [Oscillospiraceae bacterium]